MRILSKILRFRKKKRSEKKTRSIKESKIVYKPPFGYDYTFKIVLLGDPEVGKANLSQKLCYNIFNPEETMTIGVEFHVKILEVKGKKIKMQIWDIAGEERFAFLTPTYCTGANAVLIVYDITNSKSVDKMENWIEVVRKNAGNVPIILLGNKIDLEDYREIPKKEGLNLTQEYNLSGFSEISTKTGENVENIFEDLSELILNFN
ncbi:MAG: Rab family GTPase [Candidatus Thorarchaeota archaeon]